MPIIIAHRGASGLAPENTLPAFERAYSLGVRCMELDVRLTRDGWPVVIHDATVDRTTDGSGAVAELALAEIRALDAARGWGGGAGVPLLAEALGGLPEDTRWLVELKPEERRAAELVEAALAAVAESGCGERVRLISFQASLLGLARERAPGMALGALTARDLAGGLAVAVQYGCEAVLPEVGMIDAEAVTRCRSAGRRIAGWTANTVAQIARLAALGVDEIITNFPDVALQELGRSAG
jgi:glycerophosphoryl diester phosphodiesterase